MYSRFLVSAVFAALIAAVAAPAIADDIGSHRTISVTGSGDVQAAPDIAQVMTGVVTEAPEAAAALAANTVAVNRVFAELKAFGIADRDMQTRNFAISPQHSRPPRGEESRIVGYRVVNAIAVRVRELDRLGALLDRLVAAGANQMNGISFSVDRPDDLLDKARREAIKDARRKADLYAAQAGVRIKRVMSISETGAQPPRPMFQAAMRADSAGAVPVAGGEQTISASVGVVYELE